MAVGYDPHYFPDEPLPPFDLILCTYVFNVLPADERSILLEGLRAFKTPGFITVRRDLPREGQKGRADNYQYYVELDLPVILRNSRFVTYGLR